MTTEDMIEDFIQLGMKSYKKLSRGSVEANRLSRHEPIVVDGQYVFSYWREYTVYRMAQYIREQLPECELSITIDGNDSSIELEVTDQEQKELNRKMFLLLKKFENINVNAIKVIRG